MKYKRSKPKRIVVVYPDLFQSKLRTCRRCRLTKRIPASVKHCFDCEYKATRIAIKIRNEARSRLGDLPEVRACLEGLLA